MPVSPNSVTMVVNGSLAASFDPPGFPKGILQTLTRAYGGVMADFYGRAATRVHSQIGETDTTVFCETTLGFPDSGQFWCEGVLFTYTGRTAGSFTGVTSQTRTQIIPERTDIVLHVPSAPPE